LSKKQKTTKQVVVVGPPIEKIRRNVIRRNATQPQPWTLNPSAAKYYIPMRLAAGFQKRSATPASYQMQSHMAILIAYCIGMKEDHQTLLSFAILAG